ncbi:hypothetical protein CDL12_01651 [Handroanthus impetiginosus]|uniref:Uncharacterized protein n=1 Tax=Handroanthus impetiginosus TaxID=429701 RepID=A0A2G9I773_9LAMI|nr:hypothetical protein CDL12_01651 [Handroanthus impetiginosus]
MALNYSRDGPTYTYMFRNEMGYTELEKRQLFLRSYQFSRKQSVAEKIKKCFFRVKRVIWARFRSLKKLRKILWLNLKNGLFFTTRRRRLFLRLHKYYNNYNNYGYAGVSRGSSSQSFCLW